MSMRMLTIETRRNLGMWLFPIVAGVAGKLAYDRLHLSDVMIWATSSAVVRDAGSSIGPFAAGAGAWIAGRESRRALGDLLETTPRPELQRRLVAWAATAFWGMLAYLAIGAIVVANSSLHLAWGRPALWPMLTGLLAVLSHAALGYALGYYLPGRFTAPLVAIGLFAVQMFVGDLRGWGRWLSPVAPLETSVWYGVRPYLGAAPALFLLGLAGLAWGAVAMGSGRRRAAGIVLICAALLTAAGVGETLRRGQDGGGLMYRIDSSGRLVRTDRHHLIPYTPMCSEDRLPVCVHPAYRSQLPEIAATLNRMAEPLIGIPGAPTKAEQLPYADRLPSQPGVLTFDLKHQIGFLTVYHFALKLTRDWSPTVRSYEVGGEAQTALEVWLMERGGIEVDCGDGGSTQSPLTYERRVCETARRFAALEPATQRAWLSQHYADLRAGKLGLEDLP